jgi:hypothetical protein
MSLSLLVLLLFEVDVFVTGFELFLVIVFVDELTLFVITPFDDEELLISDARLLFGLYDELEPFSKLKRVS